MSIKHTISRGFQTLPIFFLLFTLVNLSHPDRAYAVDDDSCQVSQGDPNQNNIPAEGGTLYYDITDAYHQDSNYSGINKIHIKFDASKYSVTNANMVGSSGTWHYDTGDAWVEGISIGTTHTYDKTFYFTVTPTGGGTSNIEFRASDNGGYQSGTNELCDSSGISWISAAPEPETCPEGQTGTPPNCTPLQTGGGGTDPPTPGASAEITPRDVALMSWLITGVVSYKIIMSFRYRGYD